MRIGLIGFGSIGRALHARLQSDPALSFVALTRSEIADLPQGLIRVATEEALLDAAPDLIVECAGHRAVQDHGAAILRAGAPLIIASLGALADPDLSAELENAAATPGARLIYPSGAIGGLDLLRAVTAEGPADITYEGRKPPAAWKGSPAEDLAALDRLTRAEVFFRGTAREAARAFPKNANVVAALALAGGGFDAVQVALIADPDAFGNTHSYKVDAPLCRYEMTIENAPSAVNARTSLTTVLSLVGEVRAFVDARCT